VVRTQVEVVVTIDRAVFRKRLVGWKPKMTIEVEVQVLTALLDELDEAERRLAQCNKIAHQLAAVLPLLESP
jgi:hypothetical protein